MLTMLGTTLVLFGQKEKQPYERNTLQLGFSGSYFSIMSASAAPGSSNRILSSNIQLGYFFKDNWMVGARARTHINFVNNGAGQRNLFLDVNRASAYLRKYEQLTPSLSFFAELEAGYRNYLDPNTFEGFRYEPFVGLHSGLEYRPNQGVIGLEAKIGVERGFRSQSTNFRAVPQIGINFYLK